MKPHNKSTLWDEYLEHYDRNKKYFNTKHKKAYCRRCIQKAVEDLNRSRDARTAFDATNFVEGWDEWKLRQGKQGIIFTRSSERERETEEKGREKAKQTGSYPMDNEWLISWRLVQSSV